MRRQDREITDGEKIREIIRNCDCCRLGIVDAEAPYVVPMNFGYEENGKEHVFYFHCASEGRKLELLKANPCVGFEMDTNHKLISADRACGYTFLYSSVIGRGVVSFVTDVQTKKTALESIMRQCTGKTNWVLSDADVQRVTILKLDVTEISCKEHA